MGSTSEIEGEGGKDGTRASPALVMVETSDGGVSRAAFGRGVHLRKVAGSGRGRSLQPSACTNRAQARRADSQASPSGGTEGRKK